LGLTIIITRRPSVPQGLLSTTYQVDVLFSGGKDGAEEKKSIFVKVPLTGPRAQDYKEVTGASLILSS
jgi:hypothetical protein